VIDASAVGNKLTFTGNGNANTFIGTMFGDKFYGNGGHDTLTGGAGKDGFYFGLAHAYTGTAYADSTQTYTASSDYDTITDFISGKDKIYLDKDLFSAWDAIGKISTAELEIGEDHTTAMTDSKIYLEVDSDNDVAHLYYVAGASNEQIVDLIGVSTIIANDIAIFNGSPAAVTL
jgi:Ca2+-binding RTX toxin-like protein